MSDEMDVAVESRPAGRGRAVVIALVVLVVVLVAALASLSGDPETPAPTGDPAATLNAALAQGEPIYILIHSLT